jgi:DNA-directed RNA polymerase specialized sigma24 family protein
MSRNFTLTDADKPLLGKLSAKHREILGCTGSYDEIAAALNLNPGTVRSRLNRARNALERLRANAADSETQQKAA